MASLVPTRRLTSVDLPAFGRPMKGTNPVRMATNRAPGADPGGLFFGVLRGLGGRALGDPDFVDAPPLGVDHLDAEAVDLEALADVRHTTDVVHQIAADRLEPGALDVDVEALRQLVDVHLAAEHEAAVALVDDRLGLRFVLAADLAHDP